MENTLARFARRGVFVYTYTQTAIEKENQKMSLMLQDPFVQGKTKAIFLLMEPQKGLCIVHSKDDITAGDGKRHDVIPGKGILANTTTINVFLFLQKYGVPLAFLTKQSERSFIAKYCTMLPVEVVIRGVSEGSHSLRNPDIAKGTQLFPPVVEFYYKTSGKKAFGVTLPCDDPLIIFEKGGTVLELHHPKYPIETHCILRVGSPEVVALHKQLLQTKPIAQRVFSLLAEQWRRELGLLIDLKIEFGVTSTGEFVVADVIDPDSWRVVRKKDQLSKEPYRQGAPVEEVKRLYTMVADLTSRFS